jgi:hypothetical protein
LGFSGANRHFSPRSVTNLIPIVMYFLFSVILNTEYRRRIEKDRERQRKIET